MPSIHGVSQERSVNNLGTDGDFAQDIPRLTVRLCQALTETTRLSTTHWVESRSSGSSKMSLF